MLSLAKTSLRWVCTGRGEMKSLVAMSLLARSSLTSGTTSRSVGVSAAQPVVDRSRSSWPPFTAGFSSDVGDFVRNPCGTAVFTRNDGSLLSTRRPRQLLCLSVDAWPPRRGHSRAIIPTWSRVLIRNAVGIDVAGEWVHERFGFSGVEMSDQIVGNFQRIDVDIVEHLQPPVGDLHHPHSAVPRYADPGHQAGVFEVVDRAADRGLVEPVLATRSRCNVGP